MVAVLQNLQLALAIVFSPVFSTVLEDLVDAFNGEQQSLHSLRTDIVLYRVDVFLRACFRAISADKKRSDFVVNTPEKCYAYICEEVTQLVAHLSDPAKVMEDTARYIHDISVAKGTKGPAAKVVTEKAAKDVILTRSTTVKQKSSKGPCRFHAAWVAGMAKEECPYKDDCIFEHVPSVPAKEERAKVTFEHVPSGPGKVERAKVTRGKRAVKTPPGDH